MKQAGFKSKSVLRCTCDAGDRLERVPSDPDNGSVLKPFQRDLKELSEQAYAQLRDSMEQYGFTAPMLAWRDDETVWVLDGHQRLRVLDREGWTVHGGVPVVCVEAETQKEAAEKLLVIASNYGDVDKQGLYEFGAHYEVDLEAFDLAKLPEVDWGAWKAEFYGGDFEPGTEDDQGKLDELAPKLIKCPHCGQEIDLRDVEG
jgi:ParB family transcriptional regulator, chromosome partitioning protein